MIRTLNDAEEVVTGIGVPPVKFTVSLPGSVTAEKYVVELSLLVILISEIPAKVPVANVTVRSVTESVPVFVCKVKTSRSVMPSPGASVSLDGFVPSPIVVRGVKTGVAGEPVGTTPEAE